MHTVYHATCSPEDVALPVHGPIGSDRRNRRRGTNASGVEKIIGNFGTALALRTQLSSSMSFRQLLQHAREVSLNAFKHQDISFDRLVEELKPEPDPSYNPLIQVGFVVHTAPVQASVSSTVSGYRSATPIQAVPSST